MGQISTILDRLLGGTQIGPDQALMLALLLLFVPAILFFTARARAGRPVRFRSIPAFQSIKDFIGQASEKGQTLHLSMGTAGIGDSAAMETVAGLNVLDYMAERGVLTGSPPLVTVANPTLLPAAQDLLRHHYTEGGFPEAYDPDQVRFIAPDPVVYASGVSEMLERRDLATNIMVGSFGDEFLLIGETGAKLGHPQVAGGTSPVVLPFMYASAENLLMGEEIFAAGAYLSALPAHIGSLKAQDVVRLLFVALVIGGVILRTVGG